MPDYDAGDSMLEPERIPDEEEWVDTLLSEVKKNRRVTIDDIITATVDQPPNYDKQEAPPAKGKPGARGKAQEESEKPEIQKNLRPSSPRSLKACLKLGIDPSEVVYRPIHSFLCKNAELQAIAYEKYESLRREKLNSLKETRQELVNEGAAAAGKGKLGKPGMKKGGDDEDASMIEREKKRVEMLVKRNKREMDLVLTNETKLQHARVAEEAKQKRMAELEAAREVERQRHEAEFKAAKRERDLERARMEEEAQHQLKLAHQEHFRKQKLLEEKLKKERQRRLEEQRMEEEQRQAKAASQRAELERILKDEADRLLARQKVMEKREAERQKMMATRKAERAAANGEKRAKSFERVFGALEAGRKLDELRRKKIQDKLDENQRRLEEATHKHSEDEKRRREYNAEKARQRQGKFEEAKYIEEFRIKEIVSKAEVVENKLQETQQRWAFEKEKHWTKKKLSMEERKVKVEENKRAAAYNRYLMRQKIEEDTARARAILKQREELQEQRRMANIEASMNRQALNQAMEKLKVTKKWNQLDMSGGNIDLATIQKVLAPRPSTAPFNPPAMLNRASRGQRSR